MTKPSSPLEADAVKDLIAKAEATGEAVTPEKVKELRNLFDIDELLAKQRIDVPTLGFYVEYVPLTAADRTEVFRVKDQDPDVQRDLQNRKELYLMLKKANPNLMEQQIHNLPAVYVDAMLVEIRREQNRFLLPLVKHALTGSGITMPPNENSS